MLKQHLRDVDLIIKQCAVSTKWFDRFGHINWNPAPSTMWVINMLYTKMTGGNNSTNVAIGTEHNSNIFSGCVWEVHKESELPSGADRLLDIIEDMTSHRPSVYFKLCWKYFIPMLTTVRKNMYFNIAFFPITLALPHFTHLNLSFIFHVPLLNLVYLHFYLGPTYFPVLKKMSPKLPVVFQANSLPNRDTGHYVTFFSGWPMYLCLWTLLCNSNYRCPSSCTWLITSISGLMTGTFTLTGRIH